jgi:hypothetical protein
LHSYYYLNGWRLMACLLKMSSYLCTVLRIRIRMNPHDFGFLGPHPESAFQMRIPDADPDYAT